MSRDALPKVAAATAVGAGLVAWALKHRREQGWEATLDRVSQGVVVVRVSCAMSVDMNEAGYSLATGFVVDRQLGIIMTNRHVVTTGPVTADAVLLNKEEVELTPLYADPVHDFGFFRYDPAAVKFMQLFEVPLAPSEARVGVEVRVVGNDAGEKISILSGTLARLDRAAPAYGVTTYNDFNTFYYSCASNTSGGSSGSPVINAHGNAIALNAGTSTKSASSYYLPLERPARALRLLQEARRGGDFRGARAAVPRGSLCCVFGHHAFGELRRLGLRDATEAAVRRALPRETGMLVVDQVVPGGPACELLQPGDVLLGLRAHDPDADEAAPAASECGAWCTTFLQMEGLLDEIVGRKVWAFIQRGGADEVHLIEVQDLHDLSPSALLDAGGCAFHALSYQQARNWNMLPGSVHAAFSGYMLSNAGVPGRAVIREFASQPTPTLADFERVFCSLHDGARVAVRYVLPLSQHQERVAVVTVDRTWFGGAAYELNELTGRWSERKFAPPPPTPPPVPRPVRFAFTGPEHVQRVTPSLVRVLFDIPYQIDGVAGLKYIGAGVVVDAKRGLVLVDRNTVPVALGDVRVEFACTVEVAATARFLHPTHNFAVVEYDPAAIDGDCVTSVELSASPLEVGEECTFVGLSKLEGALPVYQECIVRETCAVEVGLANVPRFRAVNEEVVRFDLGLALEDTIGGIFIDEKGRAKALWAAYSNCSQEEELYEQFEGIGLELALPMLATLSPDIVAAPADDEYGSQGPPSDDDGEGAHESNGSSKLTSPSLFSPETQKMHDAVGALAAAAAEAGPSAASGAPVAQRAPSITYFLDAELRPLSLSTACGALEGSGLGLSREWAERLSRCDLEKRQVLAVQRLLPGAPTFDVLKEGDLLLAVDGAPVNTFAAVEAAVQLKPAASLTVLRDRAELQLDVRCSQISTDGTTAIVQWCGLILQHAYRAVLERGFEPATGGVYISYYLFGSPAHKYKLVPKNWLVELNGQKVPDLPGFLALVRTLRHGDNVRVKTCDLNGKIASYTIKTDHDYWRSYEVCPVEGAPGKWEMRTIPEPE